eukprot:2178270-Prymnesium_polylepis.1
MSQASEPHTSRHMRYAGGSLARDGPDTPWRAAQWVPVAGPTAVGHRCALAARRQERSWLRT